MLSLVMASILVTFDALASLTDGNHNEMSHVEVLRSLYESKFYNKVKIRWRQGSNHRMKAIESTLCMAVHTCYSHVTYNFGGVSLPCRMCRACLRMKIATRSLHTGLRY